MSISALFQALEEKDSDKIKTICANLSLSERSQALCLAIQINKTAYIQLLLSYDKIREVAAENNNSALNWACQNGLHKLVKELLTISAVKAMLIAQIQAGSTCILSVAAENNHIKIMRILLTIPEILANNTQKNNHALCCASEKGNLEAVKILLAIDSIRITAATNNNAALRLAATNGHLNVILELLAVDDVRDNAAALNNEALRKTATNGHIHVMRELLKISSVASNADTQDNAALYNAAREGHFDVALELLDINSISQKAAANPNRTLSANKLKFVPIFHQGARKFDILMTVEFLLQNGCPLDQQIDLTGNSLIHLLVNCAPHGIIKIILERYSKINTKVTNHQDKTPLQVAEQLKRTNVVTLLANHDTKGNLVPVPRNKTDIFTFLHAIIKNLADFEKLPPFKKAKKVFTFFVDFIKTQRMQYSPNDREEGKQLLECQYGHQYKVNCHDLSYALGYLMQSFGISDLEVVEFPNACSLPFSPKPAEVKGDFICFDQTYHNQYLQSYNNFIFKSHYVLKCMEQYFDPTFGFRIKDYQKILAHKNTI